MSAILFGSISTVADTSELQRQSFNEAFAAHGLDWTWEREDYVRMLEQSGGADRVTAYAQERGVEVDAAAVHRTKSEIFQKRLITDGVEPRDGVVDTIAAAQRGGVKLGLVTTTSPDNVEALVTALRPHVDISGFDVVVDVTQVEQPKPDRDAYDFALDRLGETSDSVVAVEDNLGGVQAAASAGLVCVAFPNTNTSGHDFAGAHARVDRLDADQLIGLATSA
ncbi:haloacid dehalogenase superfamily, subfamily IA, variant 3 with third motif having DD or ED [Nocardioides scoriae]|uniref:Haloacid dehalogenase superfamily, subfamily IA, variant 3 with third motif having DD or ED n=1 Tax=Nocardioides scoriae TaxID=642780 RepID=A0A1H1V599_9ACTN|nr:HAD-IA family hydrolase [Nocardioides scoriae]SDS79566.1 haloacid dehalogenase superfamily, subfamily IA, variant 3 with third motif having DD or ED [Nocardioides scoriae]